MFESLVIVTREGVEAALVVAIVLAYLARTGRMRQAPWVFAGVAVAIVASAIGAVTLPALVTNFEIVEGWALLAGGVCVLTLVWWMMATGKHMKAEIEGGLSRTGSGSGAGWGLAAFTAIMIFREGLETVLFLTAISFNTGGLERLFGALVGLALSAVFGVLFVRGTLRVDLRRFFSVTTAVLLILAVQLFVGAYHEFAEVGWAPATRESMALVGPIVRYDTVLFAVAVLLTLFLMGGGRRQLEEAPAENPAERRRLLARRRRDQLVWRATTAVAVAVSTILFTGFVSQARVPGRIVGPELTTEAGQVRVATADLEDGKPAYYRVRVENRDVRFFVVRRPQGDVVASLDACAICGDIGYYPEAGGMTCRNCTAPVNLATLGQSGGCNPIPLPARADGADLVIAETDLAGAAQYFPPSE